MITSTSVSTENTFNPGIKVRKADMSSMLIVACREFQDKPNDQKAYDKVFVEFFKDKRIKQICCSRAASKGVDFNEVDELTQRVAEVLLTEIFDLDDAKNIYYLIGAIAHRQSENVKRFSLFYEIEKGKGRYQSLDEMKEFGHEFSSSH